MLCEKVVNEERGSDQAIYESFLIAFLLTGTEEQAEAAVLEGIQWLEFDSAIEETLLLGTIEAAVSSRHDPAGQRPPDLDTSVRDLPLELKRISRLRPALRYCFVLRVLAGLSRETCARILHLQPCQVDQAVCSAAQILASASEPN